MGKKIKDIKVGELYRNSMKKIAHFTQSDNGKNLVSSVFAIITGILFGFIMMLIFVPSDALGGLGIILTGAFQKGNESFGNFLSLSAPIILTGLSVGFAFKTGLFNIGATGQFTVGAFAAIFIGVRWGFLPGQLHWIVAVLGAILAGAIWGFIPGLLKAIFNVHEVVSTIMLNYIGMYGVIVLFKKYAFNSLYSESSSVLRTAVIPKMGLDKLFPDSSITGGFFLAIIAVIIIYIVLEKTTFGFQLKAVGHNKDAAKYAGINEKRGVILSMTIAGALAGLGGAVTYLTNSGAHLATTYILLGQGFDGIAVALLGLSNPLGILAAGLFFGYIKEAGFFLQTYRFDKETISMIIASIIYFSALSVLFKDLVKKIFKKHIAPDIGGDE